MFLQVLADVPDEFLPTLHQILALTTNPQIQAIVDDVLRTVPHHTLLAIMSCKPDSKVKIKEFTNNARSGEVKHVRYASWIKGGV